MKHYTGVGSRKTPVSVLALMKEIASYLEGKGFILRSGGADGADKAFESGVRTREMKNIFFAGDANAEAMKIAAATHPAWNRCSDYAKKLHARNAFQVLGKDLKTPSKFIVCWTPDGCTGKANRSIATGGTGTAIVIAEMHNIEIFNLAVKEHYDRIVAKVRQ